MRQRIVLGWLVFSEQTCLETSCQTHYRLVEESLLVFAVPGSWFYLMFFAGSVTKQMYANNLVLTGTF